MSASNNNRSKKYLEKCGWTVGVVEHYNSFSGRRHDLFGILDMVCLTDGMTLGVQSTSRANMSARVKKMHQSGMLPKLWAAGWKIVVHGWRKGKNGRWEVKSLDV